MSLDCFQFDEGIDDALFRRLSSEGEEVASTAHDEGYGHHGGAVITRMPEGFYLTSGSGCSCGGSGYIDGPFPSAWVAANSLLSERDDLVRQLVKYRPVAAVGSDEATAIEAGLDLLERAATWVIAVTRQS